jgi:2-oxoglutarate dehydrogenase E2 component (dihydrolipoamide succinyltransferase)
VVEAAAAPPAPAGIEAVPAEAPSPPIELPRFGGEFESVAMTTMRKSIAEHMVMSKHTSAHVNTVFEVDMSAILNLRDRYKQEFEKREITEIIPASLSLPIS